MPSLRLPDGRRVSIAGEHEDFYDPHFCIFNDVVIQDGEDVTILGYPREVFPPTDFHTATLAADGIWILGALGYPGERGGAETQVFELDTASFEMRRVSPTGRSPGWIHKQRAVLLDDGVTIEVSKGHIIVEGAQREAWRKNLDVFRLNTRDRVWSKITDTTAWRQFRIEYEQETEDMMSDRDFGWYTGEILAELGARVEPAPDSDTEVLGERVHTVWVNDVAVRIEDSYREVYVVIEGSLPEGERLRLVSGLRRLMQSTNREVTEVVEC